MKNLLLIKLIFLLILISGCETINKKSEQIAKEENRFSIEDIAQKLTKKLIRRHPHVFEKPQKISVNHQ